MAEKQPEAQFSEEAYNTLLLSKINKTLEGHWKWYTINNNKNDDEFTKAELRSILHKIDTQIPSEVLGQLDRRQRHRPGKEVTRSGNRETRRPSLTSVAALRGAVCETARQPFHSALLRLGSLPQWEEPLMLHQGS